MITLIDRSLIRPERINFYIARRNLTSTNPFTPRQRVFGPTDERWAASFSVTNLSRDEWNELEATLNLVDGKAGFLAFHDPARAEGRGAGAGVTETCLTAATALRGTDMLQLTGLTASQAVAIAANDMLGVSLADELFGYLHASVGNYASDAGGLTTVQVRPRLRTDIPSGTVVRLKYAAGVFQLIDETPTERYAPILGSFSGNFIEVHEALL